MSRHSGIQRATLCVLLLSELCSCFYNYHFFAEPKTWYEARSYCRRMYKDLAFVENAEDMQRLIAAAGSGYRGEVWIGLQDTYTKWWWSTPSPNPYGHGPKFRLWASNQPNNNRWDDMLCSAFKESYWSDFNCSSTHSSVCHDISNAGHYYPVNRYVFVKEKKTWLQAQAYCRTYHTDLARVSSHTQNEQIRALVGDVPAFIGLYRYPFPKWSNGVRQTFKYWAVGHPQAKPHNCAASVIDAEHQGHWMERNCRTARHFMCYSDTRRLYKFELKFSEDLMNDPVLRENLTKEIEERLKEKGFTRDFKLTLV